ncbi:MAG: CpaF family protein [Elusimicrobiota bacterium]|jgi:pilus assembly protein CpaF
MNRVITAWSFQPASGKTTLVQAVAAELSRNSPVLLIQISSDSKKEHAPSPALAAREGEIAFWVRTFKPLGSQMVRNHFLQDGRSLAELELAAFPPLELWKDLLAMVRNAFSWVFVDSPAGTEAGHLALLDQSDLLLWVAKPNTDVEHQLSERLDALASKHYPMAFSRVVLNRLPFRRLSDSFSALAGVPILERIPEDKGADFRQRVRCLAMHLQSDNLYLPKETPSNDPLVADAAVRELKDRVQPQLLKALQQKIATENNAAASVEMAQKTVESCLADDDTISSSRQERGQIFQRVMDEVLGLGPLEPLLKDPGVSEVMVNGPQKIFVEIKGRLHETGIRFSDEKQLRIIIDRIVAPIGRRVDESMPLCDARLADGSRVNIILPPLALDGPTITIRKFSARALSLDDLTALGSLSPTMADFLSRSVAGRKNVVVSGGTGSGKTTLLNALSSAIPDDERIVTIEDAAELRLQKPHVVRLESRPPNTEGEGSIPIRRLVINALRMRPDRIVVGECRGGEALDMLQAMNTGHDGSLTTVHANSPRDALGRLETLVLMAGMDLPIRVVREQIRSAVHLIVQQARLSDGSRKIVSITEVTGMEGDRLTTQELFRFHQDRFETTGLVATFLQEIRR